VSPTTSAAAGGFDAVCAAGEEEGEVEYWGTFAPEIWDQLVAPFNELYPGIETTLLPGRPDELVQTIVTESEAGRQVSADIIRGDADLLTLLERDLLAEDIDWASLGVADNLVNDFGAVRSFRVLFGLAYNTDEVAPEELPTTWEELVDEQWSGRIAVDPRGIPLSFLAVPWGQDELIEYTERFADVLQPLYVEGVTAGIQTVASGEAVLTTTSRDAEVNEQQAAGAPIEITFLDYIPTSDSFASVLLDAQHPNAAQCLLAWLASPEGQDMELELEYKSNEDFPPGAPEDAELIILETPEDIELEAESRGVVSEILTGQ
jgi:iron(III) transport system substrate-binding protein